jgi:hypothetical protein
MEAFKMDQAMGGLGAIFVMVAFVFNDFGRVLVALVITSAAIQGWRIKV